MRKVAFLEVFLSLGLYSQSVVHTIPAPDNPSGLAWDGENLWCGIYGPSSEYIYKIDPEDGGRLDSILCPGYNNTDCYGLEYDGRYLWVVNSNYNVRRIYKIATDGTIVDSFPQPFNYMAGLTYDGNYVRIANYYPNDNVRIHRFDPITGDTITPSIPSPHPQPWGLAWDGECLWVTDDGLDTPDDGYVFKLDSQTGEVLDSFPAPGNKPRGATWDGKCLWVTGAGPTKSYLLYQIDVSGGGTPDIELSSDFHDFGEVTIGSSELWELTISNAGDAGLVIDSICITGTQFTISEFTFPFTLTPSSDTILTITFTPSVFGEIQSDLTVYSNDPDEGEIQVALSGFGLYSGAVLALSDSIHDYGDIRISGISAWEINIIDEGEYPLVIDSIEKGHFFFTFNLEFPITVNSLDTLRLMMYFSPQEVTTYDDTISIFSSDESSPHNLYLSGGGVEHLFGAGDYIFTSTFPANVVCVTPGDDINGDSIPEIVIESYDAFEGYGRPHLYTFFGNSDVRGAVIWAIGDESFSGGWGDNCLRMGGDLNGDGIRDILLGTAWGDRSCYAIDAVGGDTIWRYDSHQFDGEGGWVYAVSRIPDVNDDGVDDVLAGIGGHDQGVAGPRSMYCFDGQGGDTLWRFQLNDGVGDVTFIDDVNGDGKADAVCGAYGNDLDRHIYCINGATGTQIWSYDAGGDIQTLITIPDINGDGIDEVVAGTWAGTVVCLSGANGSYIWSTIVGGWVVKIARVPNAFGSGVDGIVSGSVAQGALYLLSSEDGSMKWSYPVGGNVWSVDAIEDIDDDGCFDVLAGTQTTNSVLCISGATGDLLWQYGAKRLVYSVRSVSDITGDGYPDVIAGTQSQSGEAYLIAISSREHVEGVEEELTYAGLLNVYPNPFGGRTNICFYVNKKMDVRVEVYNILGKKVRTVYKGDCSPGIFNTEWNGKDDAGRRLPNGVYFLNVNAGRRLSKKIILMR